MFFVVNAGLAVAYNTVLVPRIRVAGYPRLALLVTTTAVPVGVLFVRFSSGSVGMLYLGGALMLFVSTVVPQLFGRVASQNAGHAQEWMVARLRTVLISGYILGLVLYSMLAQLGVDPLVVAAGAAGLTIVCTAGRSFARRLPVPDRRPDAAAGGDPPPRRLLFVLALALVALLKSVDTLRAIYLPLFAVSSGVPPALVSPVFLASAVLELAALPALTRLSTARGSAFTLGIVSLAAIVTFAILVGDQSYGALVLSQAVYAVVGAGFQSIGILLLERTSNGGPGAGASAYTAVTQVGTVLGALLPLAVSGYDPQIFLIAVLLSAASVMLAVALRVNGGRL
ncbi:hypothetical protein GRS96_15660 [Rathayibacter sp. VKM Ac-2803]|uniref:hypothetical protein n=1 Tax=Rathayibacter sp. VKM Ac-2803 TaxID=2609256 RepID=UPI00135CEBAE|nr:hypothetical protein [Rathayibacter sp. VKM Ac-2803]MWV50709.1 hypothetical protein [Rathayibacter sp. VKM Ac-2803]